VGLWLSTHAEIPAGTDLILRTDHDRFREFLAGKLPVKKAIFVRPSQYFKTGDKEVSHPVWFEAGWQFDTYYVKTLNEQSRLKIGEHGIAGIISGKSRTHYWESQERVKDRFLTRLSSVADGAQGGEPYRNAIAGLAQMKSFLNLGVQHMDPASLSLQPDDTFIARSAQYGAIAGRIVDIGSPKPRRLEYTVASQPDNLYIVEYRYKNDSGKVPPNLPTEIVASVKADNAVRIFATNRIVLLELGPADLGPNGYVPAMFQPSSGENRLFTPLLYSNNVPHTLTSKDEFVPFHPPMAPDLQRARRWSSVIIVGSGALTAVVLGGFYAARRKQQTKTNKQ